MAATRSGSSGELHELGLAAAARAIRNGTLAEALNNLFTAMDTK